MFWSVAEQYISIMSPLFVTVLLYFGYNNILSTIVKLCLFL